MKRGVEMCRNGGLVKRLRSRRREWGEGKWGRDAWQGQRQPWKREKTGVLPQKLQLQVELEILRCDRRQARCLMQTPLQVKSLLLLIVVNPGAGGRQCATILLTRLDFHAAQGFGEDGRRFGARPGYIQSISWMWMSYWSLLWVNVCQFLTSIQELLKIFNAPSPWRRCWRWWPWWWMSRGACRRRWWWEGGGCFLTWSWYWWSSSIRRLWLSLFMRRRLKCSIFVSWDSLWRVRCWRQVRRFVEQHPTWKELILVLESKEFQSFFTCCGKPTFSLRGCVLLLLQKIKAYL